VEALRACAQLFLDVCAEPKVERIILLDAPAVLGWEAWRDLACRYGLGLIQLALQSAMDAGAIVPQPVVPSPTSSSAHSTSARSTLREPGPGGGARGVRRDY
jgi:hypothetical protein